MGKAAVAVLVAGMVAWALPEASAQTQPFVAGPPGTRIYTSGGNWHEIDSVDGTLVRALANSLNLREWHGFCDWPAAATKYDRRAADGLWPLSVGKSMTVEKEREARRWSTTFRVAGRQQIKVPAGTFETWIIEAEEVGITHKSRTITRCWYALAIGFVVKRQHEVKEGSGQPGAFEVVRIETEDRSRQVKFRAPRAGTIFDTTSGSFRVDGAEGTDLLRKSDNPAQNALWLGGFHDVPASDPFAGQMSRELSQLWPLEVGKSIAFDFSRPSGGVWNIRVAVERSEWVTVPAGTYSAVVISWRERAVNGTYAADYRYWWSPALGFPVKRNGGAVSGTSNRNPFELRKATPPR